MKKVGQKNWLLLITGLLFVGSALVLFVNGRQRLGGGSCEYAGQEYFSGQSIPDYAGREDCFCQGGEIVCDDSLVNMSYEAFVSSNLNFSYRFGSFLDKIEPDYTRFSLVDINHSASTLEISLEREVLCTDGGLAPTQIGLYEVKENSLVLTTVTNRDETIYSEACIISNVFEIANFDLGDPDGFSVLYQNESAQLFDLRACYFDGKLYGHGDVFQKVEAQELCTCDGPSISCEAL